MLFCFSLNIFDHYTETVTKVTCVLCFLGIFFLLHYLLFYFLLKRLQKQMSESGIVYQRRKLRVNVNKSKLIRCSRGMRQSGLSLSLDGKDLEEMEWM